MSTRAGDLTAPVGGEKQPSDDPRRSVSHARRILGDDFEPLRIGVIESPEPELDRAVDELRRIRDSISGLAHSHVRLDDVADKLAEVADLLAERVPDERARLETMWTGAGSRRANPVGGVENPIAPPIEVYGHRDGRVVTDVRLGLAYQGPPGCVHGGISALVIDHLMGFANAWSGRFGMTAHYEIDYRSPTPLLEDLTYAAWVDDTDGRKTYTHATVHVGDRLCVEARGLFLEARVPIPGSSGETSTVGDAAGRP